MGKIEFKQSLEELIKLGASAAREGKYVLCVHHLNDALKLATTERERSSVYRCFSDMFGTIGNVDMAQVALFKSCMEVDDGGYYSLLYDKFFPCEGFVDDGELPPPDADTILAYNDVYNCFVLGDYDKGLTALCELPPDLKSLDEVIGVLYDAIESGKKIDLSPYAYKILLLAGIFAMKSGDFVRVLLQGGEMTRALMVDGVTFFAEEIEDKRILSKVAEEFVREHEYECAEICYKKVIEDCEIDESALYYLAAINFARGKTEEAEKYWSVYKLCYRQFGAPVEGFERMFEKGSIIDYGALPENYVREDVEIAMGWTTEENDTAKRKALVRAFSYAEDRMFMKIMRNVDLTDPLTANAALETLVSPFVGDERKKTLISEMLRVGFEGRVSLSFRDKASMFDLVKFTIRSNKNLWQKVYERVSMGIVCSRGFMPYKPNYLSHVIKTFAKRCTELKIDPEEDDVPFLSTIIASKYNDRARNGNNLGWVNDAIPPISPEELKKGLKKYPPKEFAF